jgi:hypothetical protein
MRWRKSVSKRVTKTWRATMSEGGSYVSAFLRLSELPEVFTGAQAAVLFGWPSSQVSTYLANWRRAGLVKTLGRSDVHLNWVRDRNLDVEAGLARLYPSAIKAGVDVLRRAGWTTQIPSSIEVRVEPDAVIYELEGYQIEPRPRSWFSRVSPGLQRSGSDKALSELRPAWALADMIQRAQDRRVRHAWLPDPDDLDWYEVERDPAIDAAAQAFGLDSACLSREGYEQVYAEVTAGPDRFTSARASERRV